jgi:hypothetical protein
MNFFCISSNLLISSCFSLMTDSPDSGNSLYLHRLCGNYNHWAGPAIYPEWADSAAATRQPHLQGAEILPRGAENTTPRSG